MNGDLAQRFNRLAAAVRAVLGELEPCLGTSLEQPRDCTNLPTVEVGDETKYGFRAVGEYCETHAAWQRNQDATLVARPLPIAALLRELYAALGEELPQ